MPTIHALRTLADVYRDLRPVSQVYLDVSIDSGDPPDIAFERGTAVADELRRQGAPQGDIDALFD